MPTQRVERRGTSRSRTSLDHFARYAPTDHTDSNSRRFRTHADRRDAVPRRLAGTLLAGRQSHFTCIQHPRSSATSRRPSRPGCWRGLDSVGRDCRHHRAGRDSSRDERMTMTWSNRLAGLFALPASHTIVHAGSHPALRDAAASMPTFRRRTGVTGRPSHSL